MMTSPTRVAGLLLLAVMMACDTAGPEVGPPSRIETQLGSVSRVVGATLDVSVTVYDAEDRAVEGATVTWSASGNGSVENGSTVTDGDGTSSGRWTLDTVSGSQQLTLQAGSASAEVSLDALAGPLYELLLTPGVDTLRALNDSLTLVPDGVDEYGNEAEVPSLTWSSSDPTIASVADGIVVAHADGTVDIIAGSGSLMDTASITVDQAIDTLAVDPASVTLAVGETRTFTATLVDARGFAVDTTIPVTWASSAPAVATADTGVVTAVADGTATITATAGDWAGEADVTVSSAARPTIAGIAPATLGAGDTATITGTDFGTDIGAVTVTVGGLAATVLTVADTVLTAEMPAPGSFPCAPAGDRDVIVSVGGLEASAAHPVAGATRHTLAVGGSVALLGDDVACNELTETGSYVISVFNASTSPEIITAFRLQGTGATGTTLDRALTRPRIELRADRPTPSGDPRDGGHLDLLERNRRLVEELGPPTPILRDGDTPVAAETVGDLRTFRIPDLDADNLCSASGYIEVTARATYVGTYGVIWEDTLAPLAGTMDAVWDTVGMEYDTVMHQVLLDQFGDPLVYDDRLDGNNAFFMLYSEVVNDYSTAAVNGFVFAGDFYTRAQCASSNEGEIFYGRVPTVEDTDGFRYDPGEIGDWRWQTRGTVIHEVKHLTSYANKFDVNAATLEESGLEEATARLAEEFYGRALQGYGQGDNVGYDASIFCERRVGANWPDCDRIPLIMGKHYSGLNTYLKTPALLTPFGRPAEGSSDASFYGSGWQWVRWAIDQSGLPEADVIKPLVREPSLTGPENLADKVGDRTVAQLLADFHLALVIDDHPSGTVPARAELTIPSWDTRDIFQGLYDDYAGTSTGTNVYPTPWPLAIQAVSGAFQVDVPEIHGGGASFFELDGMTGPQLLELLSESGGTAPASLGLSIVRIQ